LLSSQIEDMTDSIVSFYDGSIVQAQSAAQAKIEPVVITEVKKVDPKLDEAGLWKLFASAFSQTASSEVQQESTPVVRKDFVSKASIESRTRALVHNLKQASLI
jgi:hypothetical protein